MNDKRKAIIGFGVTGKSVANYLLDKGFKVSVFDSKNESDFDKELLQNLKDKDVQFNFATNDFNEDDFDLIVASPGVPIKLPVIARAKEKGIPVHTDVTIFIEQWRETGPIVGVTGSNGKTTIVTLIHTYLKKIGKNSILAGNIGNSPLEEIGKHEKGTIAVLELSSYQLEYFQDAHYLDVCLISNLSSNHLDRHNNDMDEYAIAKMNGIDNEKTSVVVCLDDQGTKKHILPKLKAKNVSSISLETQIEEAQSRGVYSDHDGDLALMGDDGVEKIFTKTENRKLIGLHNLYNIALSYAVLDFLNIDLSKDEIFREFVGLEHRIEFVREIEGVKYFNDSKSTSPDSTRVAIESLSQGKNIILIIGGKDKGMDFKNLKPYLEQGVKKIVLLPGDIESKIKKILVDTDIEIKESEDLVDAVKIAKEISSKDDIVLLSPASASFQAYKNFEERGEHFKEIVNNIE